MITKFNFDAMKLILRHDSADAERDFFVCILYSTKKNTDLIVTESFHIASAVLSVHEIMM